MKIVTLLLTLFFAPFLLANPENNIKQSLAVISPSMHVDEITETPVKGLYQVVAGSTILYVNGTGKYFIDGNLYQLADNKEFTDLTAQRREVIVKQAIDAIDPSTFITFPAAHEKTYITILTDIDCTYCRALHKEVPELNAAGITVRYMAFPRVPAGETSFIKAQSVWCATDRNAALTAAKEGKEPVPATCNDPVGMHQKIGRSLQFSVTPIIIFKNGTVVPGYLPAKELIKATQESQSS